MTNHRFSMAVHNAVSEINAEHNKKEKLKDRLLFVVLALIFVLGHSLAYDDYVAQADVNCSSETYVNDNNLECGE